MSEEILSDFLVESTENLLSIQQTISHLRKFPQDKEQINLLYRVIHTLKGSSNFFHFEKLEKLTHSTESILSLVRENKIYCTDSLIDVLEIVIDNVQIIIQQIEQNSKEGELPQYEETLRKLFLIQESSLDSYHVEDPHLHLVANENIIIPKNDLYKSNKISEDRISQDMFISKNTEKNSDDLPSSFTSNIANTFVRVNVDLLDRLMNQVGELVLNRNQILQLCGMIKNTELSALGQQLNLITSELQEGIIATRMQPLSNVLSRFERIVRDLSREQGKKVCYKLEGEETELDKSLIEAIKDPLTHIVRNSVDHGIELPNERIQKGKPEEGTLKIKAFHESGKVVVEIRDDGKGLDTELIINKAIEKGLLTPEKSLLLDKSEIFKLIFEPGFSTAKAVTQISGRGVGMDVVKKNIEKVGGSAEISSDLGFGTVIQLKIPLTLAIVSVLTIEIQTKIFAIAQNEIQELIRVDLKNKNEQIRIINHRPFLVLRNQLIPLFITQNYLNKDKQLTLQDFEILNIVVINQDGLLFGLIVDQIKNTVEIVVKPFGEILKDIEIFAGATIMGDGELALILSSDGFFKMVTHGLCLKDLASQQQKLILEQNVVKGEYQENLLFDLDEDKSIFAINLSFVYRLEKISFSQIEWSDKRAICRYLNKAMNLIDLVGIFNPTKPLLGKDELKHDKDYDCIVISIKDQLVGLLVRQILDISLSELEIDTHSVGREEILGTFFLNNRLVNLIQPYIILDSLGLKNVKNLHIEASLSGKKILVIDDSLMYRKLSEEAVKDLGANVKTAIDGFDAIEMCRKEKFDLILTDIEMPRMDGYEFCRQLRHLKNDYINTPVIAVSTKVSEQDKLKGREAGFNSHLEKFRKDDVIREVQKYLIL